MVRSARGTIQQSFANPALKGRDLRVLEAVLSQYAVLEQRWSWIAESCGRMPQTLVHGDLAAKNTSVRKGEEGISLVVMDWETAGWGVPAIDLCPLDPDLAAYWSAARQSWTGQTSLLQAAAIGKIFRLVVAASWETGHLSTPWVARAMRHLKLYQTALGACLQEAGWEQ
jgi:aminoglycoside phosphotransferase (APT) family kinase protein